MMVRIAPNNIDVRVVDPGPLCTKVMTDNKCISSRSRIIGKLETI